MATMANDNYRRNQLFLAGMALIVLGGMAMFFLSVSWFFGGGTFMDTLYGKETLAVLAAGIVAGFAMVLAFRERETGDAR
jgi:hypothetical protein